MRFAIVALLALFAFNGASAFFFPDNEIFRPFQRPMQWLGDRLNGGNNDRRPTPSWRDATTRQPWRPLANSFGLGFNNNNNNDNRGQNNQPMTTMYPPHPKLVAPRPSYLGTSNKLGSWSLSSNNNNVIPEITNGRMPEFKPEDYYPYGKK